MLFKNHKSIAFASICIVLAIAFYKPFFKKVIKQGFENPPPEPTPPPGCELQCDDKDLMTAVKREFESNYLEGFSDLNEGGNVKEAFQDPAQLLSTLQAVSGQQGLSGLSALSGGTPTQPPNLTALTGLLGTGVPNLGALQSLANSTGIKIPSDKLSRYNLKKIHRTLRLAADKCEYEVTYDKSDIDIKGKIDTAENQFGYFQATFVKDSEKECVFKPKEVRILLGPKIIRYDTLGKTEETTKVDYTF